MNEVPWWDPGFPFIEVFPIRELKPDEGLPAEGALIDLDNPREEIGPSVGHTAGLDRVDFK